MITRTAGFILVLPDGRWVMQRRTEDAPSNAGLLGLFGGGLELGETPEQAARRELAEETDLDPKLDIEYLCTIELADDGNGNRQICTLFRMAIPNAGFKHFEGSGVEVYSIEELALRSDLAPVPRMALKATSCGVGVYTTPNA